MKLEIASVNLSIFRELDKGGARETMRNEIKRGEAGIFRWNARLLALIHPGVLFPIGCFNLYPPFPSPLLSPNKSIVELSPPRWEAAFPSQSIYISVLVALIDSSRVCTRSWYEDLPVFRCVSSPETSNLSMSFPDRYRSSSSIHSSLNFSMKLLFSWLSSFTCLFVSVHDLTRVVEENLARERRLTTGEFVIWVLGIFLSWS
mgnify:CR=1 FL=1